MKNNINYRSLLGLKSVKDNNQNPTFLSLVSTSLNKDQLTEMISYSQDHVFWHKKVKRHLSKLTRVNPASLFLE